MNVTEVQVPAIGYGILCRFVDGSSASCAGPSSFGLALQWSPSFYLFASPTGCGSAFSQTDEFYIHGLWASNQAGLPLLCTRWNTPKPVPKNMHVMMPTGELLLDIQTLWPNLKSKGTMATFWKHEYEKHGICFMVSSSDYFRKAKTTYDDVLIEMNLNHGSSLYHNLLLPLGNVYTILYYTV